MRTSSTRTAFFAGFTTSNRTVRYRAMHTVRTVQVSRAFRWYLRSSHNNFEHAKKAIFSINVRMSTCTHHTRLRITDWLKIIQCIVTILYGTILYGTVRLIDDWQQSTPFPTTQHQRTNIGSAIQIQHPTANAVYEYRIQLTTEVHNDDVVCYVWWFKYEYLVAYSLKKSNKYLS